MRLRGTLISSAALLLTVALLTSGASSPASQAKSKSKILASTQHQAQNKNELKSERAAELADLTDAKLEPKQDHESSQLKPSPIADGKSLINRESSADSVPKSPAAVLPPLTPIADEEYVQVRPEEMSEILAAKPEVESASDIKDSRSAADDELSAHLAREPIGPQESVRRGYRVPAPPAHGLRRPLTAVPQPPAYRGSLPMPRPHYGMPSPLRAPTAHPPRSRGQRAPPSNAGPYRLAGQPRLPPSYVTIKGKLTGINSLVSQYPHPAPGYPHHGPRHLPRGAAAGYAAFRDFVRAHASKYKQQAAVFEQMSAQGGYPQPITPPQSGAIAPIAMPAPPPYKPTAGYQAPGHKTTKLSVAQAYIPHMGLPGASMDTQSYGSASGQKSAGQSYGQQNQMLTKLYGQHLPHGVGRPEYNKDYGMIIHYPQATVYTEPMTVDQLHKLTGAGIEQVIAHLHQNGLGHKIRDESNIIRPNNAHHLGHGLSIQAKQFYAPDKGGRYVPTTAAVISSSNVGGYAGPEPARPSADHGLGSGYERVRQAVNAAGQQQSKSQAGASYSVQSSNGEPLSSIADMIGTELEALYKANAHLNKQLEPEIHAQVQAYIKSGQAKGPLRYTEHSGPLQMAELGAIHGSQRPQQSGPREYPEMGPRNVARRPRHGPRSSPYSNRPAPNMVLRPNQLQAYSMVSNQQQQAYRQQQQSHQAAEQAMQQQMMDLIKDFQSGDDQYNGSGQQNVKVVNQGYPYKVMQKQQLAYNQQAAGAHYNMHEGLEIPQGPNDQIGEITDLIESLRHTLESQKLTDMAHELQGGYKQAAVNTLEDVRYLASALGQPPSYTVQVPVSGADQPQQQYQQPQAQPQQQPQSQSQPQQQYQPQAADHGQSLSQRYQSLSQAHVSSGYQQLANGEPYGQQQTGYESQGYLQQQSQMHQQQPQQPTQYLSQEEQQPKPQTHANEQSQYSQGPQSQQPAAQAADYSQAQQSPAPAPQQYAQQTGSYSGPATGQQQQQQQISGYSTSQIIDHVVPVADQQPAQEPASVASYNPSEQQQQQPVNQISLAAPTDAHYQQAQSLSSFVDSLPTDYQELLRQPMLEGHAPGAAHLAALGQEATQSGGYSNSTVTSHTTQASIGGQQAAGYIGNQGEQASAGEHQAQY